MNLVALTHTPNPMTFLNGVLGRPASEQPMMIIVVGHPIKKPLDGILAVLD